MLIDVTRYTMPTIALHTHNKSLKTSKYLHGATIQHPRRVVPYSTSMTAISTAQKTRTYQRVEKSAKAYAVIYAYHTS